MKRENQELWSITRFLGIQLPSLRGFNPKFAFGTDHKMKASLKELKS